MRKTSSVTYGAMIVGIMSLALFLDRATGGTLSPFLSLPISIPLVLYGVMFGIKDTVVVYIVSIIVSFLFSGMLPSMLMVVGYGGIALIYVYAYERKYKDSIKNFLMFIGFIVFYAIMIRFFDEYFGLSLGEFVTLFESYLPGLGASIVYGASIFMVLITIIMELVLINIVSTFMIVRLKLNVENK